MKKLFIIVTLLLAVVSTFAQEMYSYRATHIKFKQPGYEWSNWQEVGGTINVEFRTSSKRINVYSKDPQYIDYENLEQTTYSDKIMFSGYGTDTKYSRIYIKLTIWNDGDIFLQIDYSDLSYKYFMKPVTNNLNSYM